MWGQLAIKALVSGVLIALASEISRRNPGWGGLIAVPALGPARRARHAGHVP